MKELRMKDALGLVKTWGRTYWDEQDGVLYANYTCGAFEVDFQGTELTVEFAAVPDTFVPPSAAGEQPPREDWPFIAVFLDGGGAIPPPPDSGRGARVRVSGRAGGAPSNPHGEAQ